MVYTFQVHGCKLSSTERSKYSNCTVTSSKYLEENQEVHFHHHHQACLIHCFIRTWCCYYCKWFNAESGWDLDTVYCLSFVMKNFCCFTSLPSFHKRCSWLPALTSFHSVHMQKFAIAVAKQSAKNVKVFHHKS